MKFIWDPESGMPLGNIIATGVILVLIYVLMGYTFSKVTRNSRNTKHQALSMPM